MAYTIAPPGEEPPPDAVWRGFLDHERDGALCVGWVTVPSRLWAYTYGVHNIADGQTLYLVPAAVIGPGVGPDYPNIGETYAGWRRRVPHVPSGFQPKSEEEPNAQTRP